MAILLHMAATTLLLNTVVVNAAPKASYDFAPLDSALKAWNELQFDDNFAINVGDATGTLYTWSSPNFNMQTKVEGASLSKWPSAIMISGLVADGIIDYETKANAVLDWWAKDGSGHNSSSCTLRDLLSFKSGMLADNAGELCPFGYEFCAKQIYDDAKQWAEPGTTFQYLSGHLQLAGAMAIKKSGLSIEELFEKYLYKKYNMTGTSYGPEPYNPSMAGGITTTGADFENMLRSNLIYQGLPKSVQDEMETDLTKPPVSPSGDGWFGHYAMGHWWECLGYGVPNERVTPLPDICLDAHIQAGPGEFGYYPLIDRSGGGGAAGPTRQPYYMQVVLAEPNSLSGIPEYLRIVTKPVVDLILSGANVSQINRKEILKNGGGLLRRDIEFIKGELAGCACEKTRRSPYVILEEGLPADSPSTSRYDLLAAGSGLTIFDIEEKFNTAIGKCKCKGRQ